MKKYIISSINDNKKQLYLVWFSGDSSWTYDINNVTKFTKEHAENILKNYDSERVFIKQYTKED